MFFPERRNAVSAFIRYSEKENAAIVAAISTIAEYMRRLRNSSI